MGFLICPDGISLCTPTYSLDGTSNDESGSRPDDVSGGEKRGAGNRPLHRGRLSAYEVVSNNTGNE